MLKGVLDEEEIKKLEEMLKRRATQAILARMKEPLGHELRQRAVVETMTGVNIIDEKLEVLFPGRVEEWRFCTSGPGPITFYVFRPSDPTDATLPAFSYSVVKALSLVFFALRLANSFV